MAAINAGTRRQRGLLGLLCGTISIKKSALCIGDNSVVENEPIDRNNGTASRELETESTPPPKSPAVTIPSPVLVSKKLAEEAVAKRRNVRFRHHATVIEEEEELGGGGDVDRSSNMAQEKQKLMLEQDTAPANETNKPIRRTRQKRMAPAPPLPGILANASS